MELKMVTKVINVVDYDDFNNFVMSIYGGDYEFVAIQEANNDSSYEYTVSMKDLTGYRDLLNCLLEDGHIKEGDYLIDVCW